MRPIDADRLKAVLEKNFGHTGGASVLEQLIDAQPTIERKKGKWILVKDSNGKDYHKCSECLHEQNITGVKNYCAVCGADMGGED